MKINKGVWFVQTDKYQLNWNHPPCSVSREQMEFCCSRKSLTKTQDIFLWKRLLCNSSCILGGFGLNLNMWTSVAPTRPACTSLESTQACIELLEDGWGNTVTPLQKHHVKRTRKHGATLPWMNNKHIAGWMWGLLVKQPCGLPVQTMAWKQVFISWWNMSTLSVADM